jgi:hypothetical protein
MTNKGVLTTLLLCLLFGCGDRGTTQTPLQLTYGTSTQSNSNMNFQPSVVVGNQPLGKENLVASLRQDILDKEPRLSALEETVKYELSLPEDGRLISFSPLFNTSVFAAMRVAYAKEFLDLDNATRTSLVDFYDALDRINNNIAQRNAVANTSLMDSKNRIVTYDKVILDEINGARNAAKALKR